MSISSASSEQSASPAKVSPAPVLASPGKFPRWPLVGAAGIATGWIGVLAILAATTSNPITLNDAQIFNSNAVVIGRLGEAGTIVPADPARWPLPEGRPIRVLNLDETGIKSGKDYILPLSFPSQNGSFDSNTVITMPPEPKLGPMIYPATAEALAQLEQMAPTLSPESPTPATTP